MAIPLWQRTAHIANPSHYRLAEDQDSGGDVLTGQPGVVPVVSDGTACHLCQLCRFKVFHAAD
jgi:hypothetical protein